MSRGAAAPSRGTFRPTQEPVYAHKTADQSDSTLVLKDVTEMSWPIDANGIYIVEFWLFCVSAITSTGIALALNGPASPTYLRYSAEAATSGTTVTPSGANAFDTALVNSGVSQTATSPSLCNLQGYVANGANAGTLQLRFRSEVDASAATIQRGSWGKLTKVG